MVKYLGELRWEKGDSNRTAYWAFLRAASLKVSPDETMSEVVRRIAEAGSLPERHRLNHQMKSAYNFIAAKKRRTKSGSITT